MDIPDAPNAISPRGHVRHIHRRLVRPAHKSLSTSGDRNPRLQAKQRVGEVASCDETTATITRCAFKVYLVWGKKYRFALTFSTIMGKKVGWSKKTVGFKPTAFEPLALQARVVQLMFTQTNDSLFITS
jgi:hypothetical protein